MTQEPNKIDLDIIDDERALPIVRLILFCFAGLGLATLGTVPGYTGGSTVGQKFGIMTGAIGEKIGWHQPGAIAFFIPALRCARGKSLWD